MAQPIDWPARWTDDLPAIVDSLPQEYVARTTGNPFVGMEIVGIDITQHGIIRESRSPRRDRESRLLAFMSWRERPTEQWVADDDANRAFWRKASSWMSLEMPPDDIVLKGMVVTLGPYGTASWTLRSRLPERGWAVLHIGMTNPHGRDERPSFEFDVASLDDAAAELANAVDELIAEYAYAAEAGVDYVREHVPGLSDIPLAVLGLSRGALIAPAVAARLGSDVDAVALLIGGANLLQIAQSTTFKNHGLLTITWHDVDGTARPLRRAELDRLNDAYLAVSRLDPYHTAPHLHNRPTLLVTAAIDRIVPATTGRLLHERLGRPERWNYPLGHMATAWIINRYPDAIIDWLDAAVE